MLDNESEDNYLGDGKRYFSPFSPKEDEINELPLFINDINKEESHSCSRSCHSFSDTSGKPLFINNENFINYFMHIDYNTPLTNNYSSLNSNSKTPPKETNDKNILLKKKREKEYGVITDNLTGITYYEKDDPVNYKKAKKRIQNRESALRMKKLRENNMNKLDEEMNKLKEDNERLINENISLKKEKVFLIEQIKFMQKIIKESNLEFKLKNNFNENEIKNKEPVLYYEGSKQKIKGKLFNVFVVCIFSIVYIIGECSYGESGSNGKGDRNNGQAMKLNSVNNNGKINLGIWYYFSKIILLLIFFFIIPWLKDIIGNFLNLYNKRRKKKYI